MEIRNVGAMHRANVRRSWKAFLQKKNSYKNHTSPLNLVQFLTPTCLYFTTHSSMRHNL